MSQPFLALDSRSLATTPNPSFEHPTLYICSSIPEISRTHIFSKNPNTRWFLPSAVAAHYNELKVIIAEGNLRTLSKEGTNSRRFFSCRKPTAEGLSRKVAAEVRAQHAIAAWHRFLHPYLFILLLKVC